MTLETLSVVNRLKAYRVEVARLNRAIAQRKLDRAPVRMAAVQRLTDGGLTKTDAEKRHMEDAELSAYDAETARMECERDERLAEAEATKYEIEIELATAKVVGV